MDHSRVYPCLFKHLFPHKTLLRDLSLVIGGSLVVALLAQISIALPFTPVPITGQTLGVTLVGATLGRQLGFLALLTYLAEGVTGFPVFSGGGAGIARMLGATGGYLIAFPLAAALMGTMVERFGCDRSVPKMFGSMLLCSLLIFACGATWLGLWLASVGQFTSVSDLLFKAVIPFIPGDVIKTGISAALVPIAWQFLNRSSRSS